MITWFGKKWREQIIAMTDDTFKYTTYAQQILHNLQYLHVTNISHHEDMITLTALIRNKLKVLILENKLRNGYLPWSDISKSRIQHVRAMLWSSDVYCLRVDHHQVLRFNNLKYLELKLPDKGDHNIYHIFSDRIKFPILEYVAIASDFGKKIQVLMNNGINTNVETLLPLLTNATYKPDEMFGNGPLGTAEQIKRRICEFQE